MLRITQFFFAWWSIWLPIAIPVGLILGWRPLRSITPIQKIPLLISLYLLAIPLVFWFASHWDISVADYGLIWKRSLLTSILIGWGIAWLSLLMLFGGQCRLGWLNWQPQLPKLNQDEHVSVRQQRGTFIITTVLPISLLAMLIGFVEELVFRGLVLTELADNYSDGLAAILSSLIFAGLHLIWDVPGTLPQLGGLWLMGVVLVLSRWLDNGSLGLAWGLHAGWVAGLAAIDIMQALKPTGMVPLWLTGLKGQPLAGVAGVSLMGVMAIASWLML
jgi:membrane protease YdiL (CAAX protease family)